MRTTLSATFVALLLFAFPIAAAERPWDGEPFTGDPKAILAAAEAVPAGDADVVVLLEEVRYAYDDRGRATSTWRLVFRIVEETAIDDWSTVGTEWAPWYQARPAISARVISKDGGVHTLDPKAVTESAARDESADIFSDSRVLRAPLPGMAAGVVVEEVITSRNDHPLYDTGTGGFLYFGRSVPIHTARVVVDAPAALPIRFVNKTAPKIEPVKTEADGRQRIVIESARLEPLDDDLEWFLPYDESNTPYVAFTSGTSWQDTARRYSEIVEKQLGDPADVQAFLRGAIGKATDRREIARKALAAIQKNIRYAGVEVGEGSIVPRPPKDVLALKYGDCKDKATLLVAMLRAAGIPANVALLSAGTGSDIDADLPGFGRFNHVIVRVGGDDPFWIDPTDEYSPAGVLPVGDQDRLALVADAATTGLTRTPAADSAANTIIETRTFLLAEEGKSTLTEITETAGAPDSSNRRYAATTGKNEYRESMEEYAKGAYEAELVKNVATTDPRDLARPFRITIEIDKASRGSTGDSDAAVAIFPEALVESLPYPLRTEPDDSDDAEKKPKKRTHDFVVSMPYVKELRYRIVPPAGFALRALPPSETRQLGTASLATKYETASDGAVLASLRFDSGKRRLTPDEMETTRKAVSELANGAPILIVFDSVGWTKINSGDIGGAIAEFRALAAQHPKEALHRAQIGRAYFLGGMNEVAREEMRRAIALQPDYAPAHRFLGIALQHDLLAREFRKGFDLPGAIAEYRKARELDPKDVKIRAELAKLLSRGTDGELYSRGAKLDEAIIEYQAIAAELEDDSYEGELLTAMAYAGRFAEMKSRAREVKDETQRLTALVIAAAATDGTDAALREAASADTNVRRAALGGAMQTLVNLRLYPQAATMLDHAAQGSPNATQLRPVVDMLRRAKRFEDMQLADDPKSLVMKVVIVVASADDAEAAAREHVAPWVNEFEKKVKALLPRESDDVLHRVRLRTRSAGMPIRVAAEVGSGAMDYSQDGDEAHGFRVRVRSKAGMANAPTVSETYYVIRHDGRYVIGGSSSGSAGASVLHFVEKNDLETARIWLNWVREEMSAGGGDDPLTGPPFASLWPKAKATATADEIRAAAAALLSSEPSFAGLAAPLLVSARDTVPEPQRVRIDLALAHAYVQLEAAGELLPVARRIAEAAPDSEVGFRLYTTALAENGQSAEAQRLAKARLEKNPNDHAALSALSEASQGSGDFNAANEYKQLLIDRTDALPGDYNDLAWNALFAGTPLDRAIEYANHAVAQSGSASAMHTLAALYAEAGNNLEARTKLLESMDAAGREEPSSVDWYVLGRIAENYGAKDAALAAYQRVTEPKWGRAASTYELAQRRVRSLGKR